MTADRILRGRVWTGDPLVPRAEAVALAAGRVIAVGREADVRSLIGRRTEVVGGPMAAVVPGFVDAHLHFMALARRALDVDCSATVCPSIVGLLARLSKAGRERPRGAWVRAFGFDEALLAERRRPTAAELDAALPDHPLRLLHRTGHAALLNRAARRVLGVESDPRVSPDGFVERPGEWLRGRLPAADENELERQCAAASRDLLARGITTIHDPTPGQGEAELRRWRRLAEERRVRQRVRLFGAPEIVELGGRSTNDDRVRARGEKIVIGDGDEAGDVVRRVEEAENRGRPVALHAVENGALAIAVAALGHLGVDRVRRRRHRIEHASLCPPPLAAEIAASGATVVTHPDFVTRFAAKYHGELDEEQLDWLYPLRRYLDLGISVALGSDGPIAPPDPLAAIAAAVARPLGAGQAISAAEALRLHTAAGAVAGGDEGRFGALVVGAAGDAVVLSDDPTTTAPGDIGGIEVRATLVEGEVAWSA